MAKKEKEEVYLDGEVARDNPEKEIDMQKPAPKDEIKFLLEENLRLSREIKEISVYVKHFVYWQRVWGFVKLALIIIPLAVGFFLLPPLLENIFNQYQGLLGDGAVKIDVSNLDASQISDLLKK